MSVIKVTMFLNSPQGGWTESHYYFGNGIGLDSPAMLSATSQLILSRRATLVSGANVGTIRLTLVGDDAGVFKPAPHPSWPGTFVASGAGTYRPKTICTAGGTNYTYGSEPANAALYWDLFDATYNYRRKVELRAPPGDFVSNYGTNSNPRSGLNTPAETAFGPYFGALLPSLMTGGVTPWGMRGYLKTNLLLFKVSMLTFNVGPPGTITLDCAALLRPTSSLPVVSVGSVVHIHNVQGCGSKVFNGDHFVSALPTGSLTAYTLTSKARCCEGSYDFSNATVWVKVYTFIPYAHSSFVKFSAARVGNATGGTRGRRAKSCCR